MIETKLSFDIWLALLVALVMSDNPKSISDLNYFPEIEKKLTKDLRVNWLLISIFELHITPMETARFLLRCYPEIIDQITNKKKTA